MRIVPPARARPSWRDYTFTRMIVEPDTTVLAVAGVIVGCSLLYGLINYPFFAVQSEASEEDEDDMYDDWEPSSIEPKKSEFVIKGSDEK